MLKTIINLLLSAILVWGCTGTAFASTVTETSVPFYVSYTGGGGPQDIALTFTGSSGNGFWYLDSSYGFNNLSLAENGATLTSDSATQIGWTYLHALATDATYVLSFDAKGTWYAGLQGTTANSISTIPLPGSALLFGSGLLGLVALRCKAKRLKA